MRSSAGRIAGTGVEGCRAGGVLYWPARIATRFGINIRQPVYTMKLYSTDPNQLRHIFDIIIVRAPRLSLDDGGRQVVLSAVGCCHGAV